MMKNLSYRMKQLVKEELYRRYDSINKKLQMPFAKTYYADYELEQMREELRRIDEILISLED